MPKMRRTRRLPLSPRGGSRTGPVLKPLRPRETRFVEEYLKDLNATAAYARLNPGSRDPDVMGPRQLTRANIAAAIAVGMERRSEATHVDACYVLRTAHAMSEAKFGDILADDGSFKPIKAWPDVWQRMLDGVEIKRTVTKSTDGKGDTVNVEIVKIRFGSRARNLLELIGRHIDVRAFADRRGGDDSSDLPMQTTPIYVIYSDKMRPDGMLKPMPELKP